MLKLVMPDGDHDFFGLYQNDVLKFYGSHDYIDPQTVYELDKLGLIGDTLEMYDLSEEGYETVLDGEPYPQAIAPLEPYLTPAKWYA